MNNSSLFQTVSEAVEQLKKKESPSTKDGLIVIAIYKDKKTRKKSSAKVFIDGYSPDEMDVLLRDIYAQVFAIRKRNDPKMKELDDYLNSKKVNI